MIDVKHNEQTELAISGEHRHSETTRYVKLLLGINMEASIQTALYRSPPVCIAGLAV